MRTFRFDASLIEKQSLRSMDYIHCVFFFYMSINIKAIYDNMVCEFVGDALARIKDVGLANSQVMELRWHQLCGVFFKL
jgi:hypothetical protein